MRVKFQQRCVRCKKNMVPMHSGRQFPICSQCQLKEINQPISNRKMAKFFDIPHDLYEHSSFLRSIKSHFLRFGSLTTSQRSTFIKVVKELKLHPPVVVKKTEFSMPGIPSDDASTALLVNAVRELLKKDSPKKRRELLDVLAEYQRQPLTSEKLVRAVHTLAAKSRGRPKLLLMTKDEVSQVLTELEG